MNIDSIKKKQNSATNCRDLIGCYNDFKKIGEIGFAVNCLLKIEAFLDYDEEPAYNSHFAARELFKLNEYDAAIRFLEKHELAVMVLNTDTPACGWALAAEEWYEYGKYEDFLRCINNGIADISKLESKASSPYDWAKVAMDWDNLSLQSGFKSLNDIKHELAIIVSSSFDRCINNAIDSARSLMQTNAYKAMMQFLICAETCRAIENIANKFMSEASELAKTAGDYCEIATYWKNIGNDIEFKSTMELAEKAAGIEPSQLSICAQLWERFGESNRAKKCMDLVSKALL